MSDMELQDRVETLRAEALEVAEELSRRAGTARTPERHLEAAVQMQSVANELGGLELMVSDSPSQGGAGLLTAS